ncbi:hypothetical protein FF1_040911 [Malus domestica]
MKTEIEIERLWGFALAAKCRVFSTESIACMLIIVSLTWLLISLIYWPHLGGPAWGCSIKIIGLFSKRPIILGPRGLPLISSMSLMTYLAHRKIASAAQSLRAMRLMAFSLGQTRVIVMCHPDVAKEILNSSVFDDRPVKESAYSLMFNRAIKFALNGVYWRTPSGVSPPSTSSPLSKSRPPRPR